MGANAQTSVPAFTAGQVLTAAQMTQVNTGIPVFASSTERDAAFGGTGEKTLAEGQLAYLEDTNATQYYDGSTWTALGKQPGLTFIKKVTFSAVTSFSEDNVFTSEYDNYLILMSGVSSSASDSQLRLRSGGVDATGANYLQQFFNVTGTTLGPSSQTNTSFYIASDSTIRYSSRTELFNPAVAVETGMLTQSHRDNARIALHGGVHNLATAYDGFTISDNAGNITGTLWLYGFKKD
jgi:hypothetical protein